MNKALEEMQAAEQTIMSMKEFNESYKDKTLEVDLDKILQVPVSRPWLGNSWWQLPPVSVSLLRQQGEWW